MAGTPSHYSINISTANETRRGLVYHHYASVELAPTHSELSARALLDDTRRRYPSPAFKVEMTHWETIGRSKPEWLA